MRRPGAPIAPPFADAADALAGGRAGGKAVRAADGRVLIWPVDAPGGAPPPRGEPPARRRAAGGARARAPSVEAPAVPGAIVGGDSTGFERAPPGTPYAAAGWRGEPPDAGGAAWPPHAHRSPEWHAASGDGASLAGAPFHYPYAAPESPPLPAFRLGGAAGAGEPPWLAGGAGGRRGQDALFPRGGDSSHPWWPAAAHGPEPLAAPAGAAWAPSHGRLRFAGAPSDDPPGDAGGNSGGQHGWAAAPPGAHASSTVTDTHHLPPWTGAVFKLARR